MSLGTNASKATELPYARASKEAILVGGLAVIVKKDNFLHALNEEHTRLRSF
jgi:hypothetical protein